MNLLLRTPFYNAITPKSIPLDPSGDPIEPLGGVTTTSIQHVIPYYRPFMRPLNYLKYKKYFDLDVHI
jgi:hypothetical protein